LKVIRTRKIVRRAVAGLVLALSLLVASPLSITAIPVPESGHTAPAMPIFEYGARAAIAVDLSTGLELFAENADTRLPPASTMKVVTALVARSVLPLDEVVTIRESDLIDPTVFSVMTLEAGDTLTVRDLLYGLLMQSGGDAALALAREAGLRLQPGATDPVGVFLEHMRVYTASIGMTNSNFSNPVGYDEETQYTSARDLVRATEQLLRDQLLSRIVATQTAVVEVGGQRPRQIELFTSNLFLERDDVFGIKTGTDDLARQCLITGFWRGDNEIITVVLGSEERYADTQALVDWVDARYRWVAMGVGARSLGVADDLAAQGLRFMVRRTVVMTPEQADAMTWELVHDRPARDYRQGVVIFRTGDREVARLPVY
jgi:serine-type D-Ala-D-Ala carboxypeptidase (penicillin-binding protein 5/6)